MIVQSPAATTTARPSLGRAASAPARATRRGLLGLLAGLIERAGQREAASPTTTTSADRYWTTIARGL